MRTKLKKRRHSESCRNHMMPNDRFIEIYGVGIKKTRVHDDNFDTEDENYENYEHGISRKSYKANSYHDYLNNYDNRLNKGKKKKRRRRRRRFDGALSSRTLRHIMEDL